MKTQVLLALIAGAQAVSRHQPEYHSYVHFATGMNGDEDLNEDITMKGDKFHFVQEPTTNSVPTKPFAEGMNGDEDLGEDITMKGDKFHFNQHN